MAAGKEEPKSSVTSRMDEWRERAARECRERDWVFTTVSGEPVKILYGPQDLAELDYERDLTYPGEYPYTRGVHGNMYRGRLWTMRQFSGFGDAEDTNRRYHFLLDRGQTGLSVAFDFPTIMGYDSDHPRSKGEVGICGVAIDSLEDMETLFDRIDLGKISTSMTINGPAAMLYAFYLGVAEKQGVPFARLRGTIQNDILKEYTAQKSWIFPPEPSMRIITDILAFSARQVPQWNTISISGYHIREAGSTAIQELAFTLADGFAYVEAGIAVGLDVDEFAPRLSHFFNSHLDFFEEIAKFRAARRIWARHMKEKYGAKKPESWRMRFHTQTAGCTLTAQQPVNNVVRVAYQALAGVLGGTQSLHTNSMDETHALPTEKAVQIALRTQQVLAYETGVAHTIDPLGGSYFVEALTNEMERRAEAYFAEIERRGGLLKCIEEGYIQREIARSAYEYQKAIEKKEKIVVGVNEYCVPEEEQEIDILKVDAEVERDQVERVRSLRERRDNDLVARRLEALTRGAEGTENVMPLILDCTRAYATEGEIADALKQVFGEYRDPGFF